MEMKERREAISLALTNEKKEKEFYLVHAGRTGDPVGKAMFTSIASDEDEHYRRLKELYDKLEERNKWPEDFTTDISSARVAEMLDSTIRESTGGPANDSDDVEALKVALAFEEKGERFYAELAGNAENEAEKRFFTLLSSMEREHRLSLQQTLEYFDDPKGWMERMGHRHLDGA